MLFYFGIFAVIFSLIFGFIGDGGNLYILIQPFEIFIVIGTAIGSFIISNPKSLLIAVLSNIPKVTRGSPYSKTDYLELLVFLFNLFKYSKAHTLIDLETHIDNPEKSFLFKRFYNTIRHNNVLTFLCDYMRMLVLGFDNAYDLQQMMEEELNEKKLQNHDIAFSLHRLGDSLPALGILAAVLGIINAMAAIASDPDILGRKIAAALIGTFLGIFFSYGIVSPIGAFIGRYNNDEIKFFECIKSAIISHARGHPPTISIEFARQIIPEQLKPTFDELENCLKNNIIRK